MFFAALACLAAQGAVAAPEMAASQLLSRTVHTPQGREIGKIVDLLVDLPSSAAPYAVIERPHAGRYVYPLDELRLGERGLTVEDEREAFAAAPGSGPSERTGRLVAASRLIGREVRFEDGGRAGEVRDLRVDLGTAALNSVTVAYEPVYGDAPVGVRPQRLRETQPGAPLVLGAENEPRPWQGIQVLPSDERRQY